MTDSNNTKQVSMKGNRNSNFAVTQAAGIVGGVLAGASNLGRGGSIAGSLAGVAVGGVVGYAVGDILSFTNNMSAGPKILAGAYSGLMGAAFGSVAAELVDGVFGVTVGNTQGE